MQQRRCKAAPMCSDCCTSAPCALRKEHMVETARTMDQGDYSRPSSSPSVGTENKNRSTSHGRTDSLTFCLWRGGPRIHFCRHGSLQMLDLKILTTRSSCRAAFSCNSPPKKTCKANVCTTSCVSNQVLRRIARKRREGEVLPTL